MVRNAGLRSMAENVSGDVAENVGGTCADETIPFLRPIEIWVLIRDELKEDSRDANYSLSKTGTECAPDGVQCTMFT
ncbi:unnamed protein product [Calypogeia fissa]